MSNNPARSRAAGSLQPVVAAAAAEPAPSDNPDDGVQPFDLPVVADDAETAQMLATKAAREAAMQAKIGALDLEAEAQAGALSAATGIPMKAANMRERTQGVTLPAALQAPQASPPTPPPTPSPTVPQAPQGFRARAQTFPQTPPQTHQPQVHQQPPQAPRQGIPGALPEAPPTPVQDPREVLIQQVRAVCQAMNAQGGAMPDGFYLPSPAEAQRVALDLLPGSSEIYGGQNGVPRDLIVPARTSESYGVITFFLRVPKNVSQPFWRLTSMRMHPFGLDRLIVLGMSLDEVPVLGQVPASQLAEPGGAPTALLYPGATLAVRLRNMTTGACPFSIGAVASALAIVGGGS